MANLHDYLHFLLFVWLTKAKATIATVLPNAKVVCPTRCGNVNVTYPFGIGLDGKCSYSLNYTIYCNETFIPSKPFYSNTNIEVTKIDSTGKMRIQSPIGYRCSQHIRESRKDDKVTKGDVLMTNLTSYPVVFSDTDNKLTVVGCSIFGSIRPKINGPLTSGCTPFCSTGSDSKYNSGSCSSNIGCCQTAIPKGLRSYQISIVYLDDMEELIDESTVPFGDYYCGFAFLAASHNQNLSFDPSHVNSSNADEQRVTTVMDWYIGDKPTCAEAKSNGSTCACQDNTKCTDFVSGTSRGYRCNCLPGYDGNPYLAPGCSDIDECASPDKNDCSNRCFNTNGSYKCSCPKSHHGDGLKSGRGCMSNNFLFALKFSLGMGFAFICITLIFLSIRRKKLMRQREKFFEQNGGVLLKQQLSRYEGSKKENSFKIYSMHELQAITNNYSKDRILGQGGHGVVHRGIFKDGKEVAVKTSRLVDQTQIEQFINEVVILTQINHRNVVKLEGCCLETEVPILVYEYIANGTLYEHIHRPGGSYWLTWRNCIRLACEAADALSYLHSAASTPIIHRDVKSSNILIDDTFRAKISDFGASRLIPIDQTEVTTMVLGTHGYLDPEYLQTSQLTEKSDVYSFGVLLAELLTKQLPLCMDRKSEERNLAAVFLMAMKEDRLLSILDPQLVTEASEKHLLDVAKLVKNCLNVRGEDRPMMKEVAIILEGLKNQINHPWAEQGYEEPRNLLGLEDLYPAISSTDYTMSTGRVSKHEDMLIEKAQPR